MSVLRMEQNFNLPWPPSRRAPLQAEINLNPSIPTHGETVRALAPAGRFDPVRHRSRARRGSSRSSPSVSSTTCRCYTRRPSHPPGSSQPRACSGRPTRVSSWPGSSPTQPAAKRRAARSPSGVPFLAVAREAKAVEQQMTPRLQGCRCSNRPSLSHTCMLNHDPVISAL